MQFLKTLSLSLLLAVAVNRTPVFAQVNGQVNATAAKYSETPVKTVIVKNPMANDPATYFATGTVFSFEIFKPGDIAKITSAIKKQAGVESCTLGNVTGDYYQVNIVLKATKNKMWFSEVFKKAGLNTIKINNNPIVEVAKM